MEATNCPSGTRKASKKRSNESPEDSKGSRKTSGSKLVRGCKNVNKLQKRMPMSIQSSAGGGSRIGLRERPSFTTRNEWHTIRSKMLDDLKYGEWAYNCELKMMWWSPKLFRLFGADPDGKGKNIGDYVKLIHEDDRDLLQFLFDKAVKEGSNYTVTHRCAIPTEENSCKIIWFHCICKVHNRSIQPSRQSRSKKSFKNFLNSDDSKSTSTNSGRYLIGVVQDVTNMMNDSDASQNLKSYINTQEVQGAEIDPLVNEEVESANPVCRLS
ncbi:hypothetical protein AAMO2058_000966500 [Amorphochlora amoebiformis]